METAGAPQAASGGDVTLERGPHFILVEATHDGVATPVDLAWSYEDEALTTIPEWLLSPARTDPWKLLLVRTLEWIRTAVTTFAALLGIWAAVRRWHIPFSAQVQRRPRFAAFVLFVVLAVVHTWPLARDPAHLSRHDNSDAMLNEWALGWVAHQVVRDPLYLFDANIFFPEPNTLAYSEAMLVQGALGAPG